MSSRLAEVGDLIAAEHDGALREASVRVFQLEKEVPYNHTNGSLVSSQRYYFWGDQWQILRCHCQLFSTIFNIIVLFSTNLNYFPLFFIMFYYFHVFPFFVSDTWGAWLRPPVPPSLISLNRSFVGHVTWKCMIFLDLKTMEAYTIFGSGNPGSVYYSRI